MVDAVGSELGSRPRCEGRVVSDTRWLKQKGRTWYCIREVPRELRGKVLSKSGKPTKRLLRSLDTDSLTLAQAKRHRVLAEFESVFEAARRPARAATLIESAMEWRQHLFRQSHPEDQIIAQADIEQSAADIADPEQRSTFLAVASGAETPLLHHLDSWLHEGGARGPVSPRTQLQYRADLAELERWMQRSGLPPTIEAISKPVAGRYVTEMLAAGADRKTTARKVSAVSSYWRWLVKRTSIEANPWAGQSVAKASARTVEKPKRPFSDAEVTKLLSGPADQELADAMRMAALSGMRIEELYQLRVADCADGVFRINRAKTSAGLRDVPIHPALRPIVARRTKGKAANARLFPEPGEVKAGRERSMTISKRFGIYRKRLGVDDRIDGRRQSRVDLHSMRRWFITKAEQAGIAESVIQSVVGHVRHGMTLGLYSGGPSMKQRKQCVEVVRLPTLTGIR